jgi:hypothetical protein
MQDIAYLCDELHIALDRIHALFLRHSYSSLSWHVRSLIVLLSPVGKCACCLMIVLFHL